MRNPAQSGARPRWNTRADAGSAAAQAFPACPASPPDEIWATPRSAPQPWRWTRSGGGEQPSPASADARPRSSWPGSAPTWASSPPLVTWPHGLACARASASRPADGARPRPARAPHGCAARSSGRVAGPPASRAPTSPSGTPGLPPPRRQEAHGRRRPRDPHRRLSRLDSDQPYIDPGPEALSNLSAEQVERRAPVQLRLLG